MSHKNSGLTLVETMVVVTILSVLSLSVYTIFKSGIDAWSKSEERLEIYQSARVVLDQISRELVGAFSGGGAVLTGTNGATAADPDTLEFITNFSDSVYKLRYRLVDDTVYTTRHALERDYIDYSVDTTETYASTNYDTVVFVPASTEMAISNIQFEYLPVIATPTGMADWSGASKMDGWPGSEPADSLPEAVRIIMTFQDMNNVSRVFETIVYLPNSEVE